jgi:hypothetical protein
MIKIYPNDPISHYEQALVHHGKGDRKKAWEHLNRALDWWRNADEGYLPAQKARATRDEWGSPVG